MTRGKAIATVAAEMGCITEIAAHQVDALVALGVLKLDEPKTAEQQVLDIIQRHVTPAQLQAVAGAIKNAGVL